MNYGPTYTILSDSNPSLDTHGPSMMLILRLQVVGKLAVNMTSSFLLPNSVQLFHYLLHKLMEMFRPITLLAEDKSICG